MTGNSKVIERRQLYLVTRVWETGSDGLCLAKCKISNQSFMNELMYTWPSNLESSQYKLPSIDDLVDMATVISKKALHEFLLVISV